MKHETITLAGGCFWCTEALFQQLKGVLKVTPGYAGGMTENPTYDEVVGGNSGHAESIQIEFDADQIFLDKLLDIFWHTHNPTTPNQQGYDIGTQYRSVIFYQDDSQKKIAEKSKVAFEKENIYKDPIVTQIVPFTKFFPAESYHKDFYNKNTFTPYCQFVIVPKLQKLLKDYSKDVKNI